MTATVLFIGLDACEITLVERWCNEGLLPHLAALRARSQRCELDSPMETLPGAIWPEIHTGRSAVRDGHFYVPNQLHAGEERMRGTRMDEIDTSHYCWTIASRAGRRVAVFDPVQAALTPGLDASQLLEWGLHDRTWCPVSDPPALLESIDRQHGTHRVHSCDTHQCTDDGYRALRAGLLHGARAKAAFAVDMLDAQRWDLYHCTFSECHCAGHQFWHLLDPRHPWHTRTMAPDLRTALLDVYQAVDRGVGDVVAAAGPDARVLVAFSHGMDLYFDGPQLLPEVLTRLGMASGGAGLVGRALRQARRQVSQLPRGVKKVIKAFARTRAAHGAVAAAGCLVDPFASQRTRAAPVYNNRCGAVRLNLRGRDPHGCVAPGAEAHALLARIERELRALRDPASGEAIIGEVFTADARFGANRHPGLPDLICTFRTDLGQIERCVSPAVGEIHVPVFHPHAPRAGDHTPHSWAWASGAGIVQDITGPKGHVQDLSATLLAWLDVAIPGGMDGVPLRLAEQARVLPSAATAPAEG